MKIMYSLGPKRVNMTQSIMGQEFIIDSLKLGLHSNLFILNKKQIKISSYIPLVVVKYKPQIL